MPPITVQQSHDARALTPPLLRLWRADGALCSSQRSLWGTENCIVVAEGTMTHGGTFKIDVLGFPPPESRTESVKAAKVRWPGRSWLPPLAQADDLWSLLVWCWTQQAATLGEGWHPTGWPLLPNRCTWSLARTVNSMDPTRGSAMPGASRRSTKPHAWVRSQQHLSMLACSIEAVAAS